MNAYSEDLRQRIVSAVENGMTKAAAAKTFQVCKESVKRYCRLKTTTGSLKSKVRPGLTPKIQPAQFPALAEQMRAAPDATLDQHCLQWQTTHPHLHQKTISRTTLSRTLKRMGWSRKKKVLWPPNETKRAERNTSSNK